MAEKNTFVLSQEPKVLSSSRIKFFGLVVLMITIAASGLGAYFKIREGRLALEDDLRRKHDVRGKGLAQSANVWMSAIVEQGGRLISSDLFRLFASEVDTLEGDVSIMLARPAESGPGSELAAQLPLMRNLLREFVTYSDFATGRIVNTRSQTYISTDSTPTPLSEDQQSRIRLALESGKVKYAPLRPSAGGLVLDVFMPIFAPQTGDNAVTKPAAVLMLTKHVTTKLAEVLAPSPLDDPGQKLHFVQRSSRGFEDVQVARQDVQPLAPHVESLLAGDLTFGLHKSLSGQGNAYSTAVRLGDLNAWFVIEMPQYLAESGLSSYISTVIGMAVLITMVLVLALSALWWRLVGREQREVAEKFQSFSEVIREQKSLLDGINAAMTDPVALTDTDGVYRYVNQAFAAAVGRSADDIPGLDVAAVFGFDTAQRLRQPDPKVIETGEPQTTQETVFLQSRKHHFQIARSPFYASTQGRIGGVVSVFRDVTALVEAQERGRRVIQKTVDALVTAVEAVDPYLAGHSRNMGLLAAQLGTRMQLPPVTVATVEAAASLSQIGKMFIPREILNKPGALTPEEKQVMESHVEHARKALKDIEFELPVVEAIVEMNERMDGTGYPAKLQGDAIHMPARLLGVANTFCAMVRPRSYRPAMPVEKALEIIEKDIAHYDVTVVAALRELLETPAGERLLENMQQA